MVKRVAVTGGSGQIAYSLLFRIASGELFGNEEVELVIRDLPQMQEALQGVAMELEDCAFPLLKKIHICSEPEEAFGGVDVAFLVGAKPRGPGMERGDLITENAKIFVEEGKGLNKAASRDVKVLVVGNPCNTNCLIAMHHAPDLPRQNFHAMLRLDQNRAAALLARRAKRPVKEVTRLAVWGNHSATQVPDFVHAQIGGKSAEEVIGDRSWLQETFMTTVQKRGAAIIAARGKSSAASAANAALDAMKALFQPTEKGDWFSSGVCSDGNTYGIEEDLVFGFPCTSKGKGDCAIVGGLEWDFFLKEKIAVTQKELIEERDCVRSLL